MPYGDMKGPMGLGPRTGRGAGFCSGFSVPGYMNRGLGFGRGFGMGRGLRRFPRHFWGGGFGRYPYAQYYSTGLSAADEREYLNNQAEFLKEELEQVKKRLERLDKNSENS